MSTALHKRIPKTSPLEMNKKNIINLNNNNNNNNNNDNTENFPPPSLDIARESRLSKVVSLYSKGLNQEEIAQELHIDQSTVSRDLQFIKQQAKKQIEKYLREDILFEYLRYMAGSTEVTRKLWEIVQDKNTTSKEKINALSVLMQSYNSRLQTLTNAPESYMNIKKSLSEIDLQTMIDSNPVLKAHIQQKKLLPKGLSGVR
jgi:predicted transcriptional regulator